MMTNRLTDEQIAAAITALDGLVKMAPSVNVSPVSNRMMLKAFRELQELRGRNAALEDASRAIVRWWRNPQPTGGALMDAVAQLATVYAPMEDDVSD